MADKRPRVLLVDDELGYAEDIAALVSDELQCDVVGDPVSAMQRFRRFSYDLAVLDIDLQHEIDGMDLLGQMKEQDASVPVVMLTKTADLRAIIESVKSGAFYYVIKGADPSIHDLMHVAHLAIEDARLKRAVSWIQEEEREACAAILGSSAATKRIKDEIAKVASLDCTVLITGESGTGKELVARALHAASGRVSRGRFVAVNCAAFPDHLIESELFGHEKGAFTGADKRRIGKFEYAERGSILLDEVGDMPLGGQAKLLRVLQERGFERVGGNRTIATDARVIASTNRDIAERLRSGEFREDLYYRLAEYVIHVPPLRERPDDIVDIAVHLVAALGEQIGRKGMGISKAALDALRERDWRKNNVRELRNALLAAMIRCEGDTVQPEHISYDRYELTEQPPSYEEAKLEAVGRFKRRYLTHLLRVTGGNVAAAAEMAGIQRTTFHRHLAELGVDANAFRR